MGFTLWYWRLQFAIEYMAQSKAREFSHRNKWWNMVDLSKSFCQRWPEGTVPLDWIKKRSEKGKFEQAWKGHTQTWSGWQRLLVLNFYPRPALASRSLHGFPSCKRRDLSENRAAQIWCLIIISYHFSYLPSWIVIDLGIVMYPPFSDPHGSWTLPPNNLFVVVVLKMNGFLHPLDFLIVFFSSLIFNLES